VLIACWSAKGGAGTTVVTAALGLVLARRHPAGALLVDLAGDLPAALGLPPEAGTAGTAGAAGEVAVGRLPLALLASASPAVDPAALRRDPRIVVADCGRLDAPDAPGGPLAAAADRSLLVLRPCYLGLRRAMACEVRPTGVVLVTEAGRAITAPDVEDSLGVPVVAEVLVTDAVARAVDAGLLASRLPRTLLRDLRSVA
jgi:hypothetical protein